MHKSAISILLVSIMITGCLGQGQGGEDLEFNGIEYREPPTAPDFTLLDQNGDSFTLSDYNGTVIVVAFIYTTCPDICLAISANMAWAKENLDGYEEQILFISITIDPARDTVEHLAEWTELMNYDWPHLTSEQSSELIQIYSDWNIIVDNEHIAASSPPDGVTNRVLLMYENNSTVKIDYPYENLSLSSTVSDLDSMAREENNLTLGSEVNWTLYEWNLEAWDWTMADDGFLDSNANHNTHIAWVAQDANISMLPVGIDCNGKGWVMGSGGGAHCMCDDGYERPDGDWLSCVIIGTTEEENATDPHSESLGDYEVGHSTVTFILDKEMSKRVAYTGTSWDLEGFVEDLQTLADE